MAKLIIELVRREASAIRSSFAGQSNGNWASAIRS